MQTECGVQLILLAGLSLMGGALIGLSIESSAFRCFRNMQMPVHPQTTPEDAIS